MRIISGYARGRRLQSPKTSLIRPTTDRVRESLFSILGSVEGTTILDAFAGSGALGCEALSRGASLCFFCDPSKEAQQIIRHNIGVLEADESAVLLSTSLHKALGGIHTPPDIIFMDPPYHKHALMSESLELLANAPIITKDALLVVEQDIDAPAPEHDAFTFDEARLYGRTRISFLYRA